MSKFSYVKNLTSEVEIRAAARQMARAGFISRNDPWMPTPEQQLSGRVDQRSRWWVQAFQDERKIMQREADEKMREFKKLMTESE
jgi:hypothetical protein